MDIVAVGESLIDFVTIPSRDPSKILLEGNPGGGALNMVAMAAKLGHKTSYITKVGKDVFGTQIVRQLQTAGVGTEGLIESDALTTLAIVSLDASGERSFAFYRNQTADVLLSAEEIDYGLIESARIVHFGAVSMTRQPARDATLSAARYAKAHRIRLSFDPNYRASLWDDEETALRVIREGMSLADYVKVSDEEAMLLTGQSDPKAAAQRLWDEYAPEFIAVTLGAKGSSAMAGDAYEYVPGFAIKAVDTTGAGDAFWGAALHKLLEIQEQNRTVDADCLKELLFYANAAGALTTTAFGGQTAQPDDRQIQNLVQLYCKV